MKITRALITTVGAAALVATSGVAAQAEEAFSVTADGLASMGTLSELPQTSEVSLAVSNLPAGVGLYAFHCLVPPPGGDPTPTRCDESAGSLVYIPAGGSAQTLTQPITTNAQFEGKNPNPLSGDTGVTDVDCRQDMCAIYTLGAGRASTDPAYVNVFFTRFAAVDSQRDDRIRATVRGQVVKGDWRPKAFYSKYSNFTVTLRSGETPSMSSDACDVNRDGKIRALKKSGTCTVTITSPGNGEFAPAEREIEFRLAN